MAFYWSVPRERVKDRLETALSADVTSGQPLAIGMDVTIGELDADAVHRARLQGQRHRLAHAAAQRRARSRRATSSTTCACGSACSRRCSGGRATRSSRTRSSGTRRRARVGQHRRDQGRDRARQARAHRRARRSSSRSAGCPSTARVSGKLDVSGAEEPASPTPTAPSTSTSRIVVIGDGKAKLTVPNDPFLAAGVTFPRIKLGKLSGQIMIEKGRARFEGVRVHSADGDATLEGYVELHDPIGTSQMHAYLKFRPSEALVKREATVELMTNALGGHGQAQRRLSRHPADRAADGDVLPAVEGSAVRRHHAQSSRPRPAAPARRAPPIAAAAARRRAADGPPPPPSQPPPAHGADERRAAAAHGTAARRGQRRSVPVPAPPPGHAVGRAVGEPAAGGGTEIGPRADRRAPSPPPPTLRPPRRARRAPVAAESGEPSPRRVSQLAASSAPPISRRLDAVAPQLVVQRRARNVELGRRRALIAVAAPHRRATGSRCSICS